MQMSAALDNKVDKHQAAAVGVKTALAILDKWGASPEQSQGILQLSRASWYKLRKDPAAVALNHDQFERIIYLLNIHAALRTIFDNPENVYGFMSMDNHNPFFSGRSPLRIIGTGSFGALYEVHKRIDALRGGRW
ncbi:MbcA/ParS/Xre antitoxin family protein [Sodalis sp. (in: enterobacteria)]|uniref:MbcA/ParS/Xre antitoxin family protein n=1 Tax=Sodalis sp. (in: enterobacteria) TaxID=1898979 RepID=UPI003F319A31